eukprot:811986-Prorocentrum_minimum.AAC.1
MSCALIVGVRRPLPSAWVYPSLIPLVGVAGASASSSSYPSNSARKQHRGSVARQPSDSHRNPSAQSSAGA